ncbi:hypothetical protein B0A48_13041 [Cryoendolithus antarcticus]|uniref:Uncharacterized protein n=1 Tax=Cryoendolithus antarcticus TaxID=1507870 RepID=A0A1V8SNK7_9PEZI|nr:hypothetical protein B0A48_13041 [Cryoendolithus antarcticus]
MQAWSSPLPQSQWSTIPAAYRPTDWQRPPSQDLRERLERPHSTNNSVCGAPATTPAPASLPVRHRSTLSATRPRRRPQPLNEVSLAAADLSRLYPQLSPYDPYDTVADTGTLHPSYRSVSQPSTPFRFDHDLGLDTEFVHQDLLRAETYPPGERARVPRVRSDTSFDSDQEASMFAAAMVGLDSLSPLSTSSRQHVTHPSVTRESVSPIADTPRTRHALQHLASLPEISHVSEAHRQRLQASASGLDLWLPSDSQTLRSGPHAPLDTVATLEAAIDDWRGMADDDMEQEDDLPDYAASQAEAQAHQRVEAARRANELRRRWDARS